MGTLFLVGERDGNRRSFRRDSNHTNPRRLESFMHSSNKRSVDTAAPRPPRATPWHDTHKGNVGERLSGFQCPSITTILVSQCRSLKGS